MACDESAKAHCKYWKVRPTSYVGVTKFNHDRACSFASLDRRVNSLAKRMPHPRVKSLAPEQSGRHANHRRLPHPKPPSNILTRRTHSLDPQLRALGAHHHPQCLDREPRLRTHYNRLLAVVPIIILSSRLRRVRRVNRPQRRLRARRNGGDHDGGGARVHGETHARLQPVARIVEPAAKGGLVWPAARVAVQGEVGSPLILAAEGLEGRQRAVCLAVLSAGLEWRTRGWNCCDWGGCGRS